MYPLRYILLRVIIYYFKSSIAIIDAAAQNKFIFKKDISYSYSRILS